MSRFRHAWHNQLRCSLCLQCVVVLIDVCPVCSHKFAFRAKMKDAIGVHDLTVSRSASEEPGILSSQASRECCVPDCCTCICHMLHVHLEFQMLNVHSA